MRIVKTVAAMRQLTGLWRRRGIQIGFVPTMGHLHPGHLSLVERARRAVRKPGIIVASIYVNPTQFGPNEDFSRYPRDLKRDVQLSRQAGVDALFVPSDREMYPGSKEQSFSTFVVEETVSKSMEGGARPSHFRGVTTILAKLFNIVLPDLVVLGQKDIQQAAVVRRMVRDLNFPLKVVVAPTLRESDGLAMSSRNQYLSPADRKRAPVLYRTIRLARQTVKRAKSSVPAERLHKLLVHFIREQSGLQEDYLVFFEPNSLRTVKRVQRGTHLALAVLIGKTRLIDNGRL